MRDETAKEQLQQGPDPASVALFLRTNPEWLAQNPELYCVLAPPQRVHGERLADHMEAMLQAERARTAVLLACDAAAAAARRAAASLGERVQNAVLLLMRTADPAECVTQEWPGVLGIDAVTLCTETPHAGLRWVPPGTIAAALGRRPVVVGTGSAQPLLHGEAAHLARSEALILVPARTVAAILALACRDGRGLVGAGSGALAFLGQAVAAALDV